MQRKLSDAGEGQHQTPRAPSPGPGRVSPKRTNDSGRQSWTEVQAGDSGRRPLAPASGLVGSPQGNGRVGAYTYAPDRHTTPTGTSPERQRFEHEIDQGDTRISAPERRPPSIRTDGADALTKPNARARRGHPEVRQRKGLLQARKDEPTAEIDSHDGGGWMLPVRRPPATAALSWRLRPGQPSTAGGSRGWGQSHATQLSPAGPAAPHGALEDAGSRGAVDMDRRRQPPLVGGGGTHGPHPLAGNAQNGGAAGGSAALGGAGGSRDGGASRTWRAAAGV